METPTKPSADAEFVGKDTLNAILSTRTDYSAHTPTPSSKHAGMVNCASKDDLMFVNFTRIASQYNFAKPAVQSARERTVDTQADKLSSQKIEQLLDTMDIELRMELKNDISTSRLLDLSGTYIYHPTAEAELTKLRFELDKHKRVVANLMKGLKDVGRAYVESTQLPNSTLQLGNTPIERVLSVIHHEFGVTDPSTAELVSQNTQAERQKLEQSISEYLASIKSARNKEQAEVLEQIRADNTESFVDLHSVVSPCPSSQYILNKDRDHCGSQEMMPQNFCFTTDSLLKDFICPKEVLRTSRGWENDASVSHDRIKDGWSVETQKQQSNGALVSNYFKKRPNCSLSYSVTGASLGGCVQKSTTTNENSPPRVKHVSATKDDTHIDMSAEKDWSLLHSEILKKIDVAIMDCRKVYSTDTQQDQHCDILGTDNQTSGVLQSKDSDSEYVSFGGNLSRMQSRGQPSGQTLNNMPPLSST